MSWTSWHQTQRSQQGILFQCKIFYRGNAVIPEGFTTNAMPFQTFPGCVWQTGYLRLSKPLCTLCAVFMKNRCILLDHQAKQWRLRPDVQSSTAILVFRSWQRDLMLENEQGTDAKTMLTYLCNTLRNLLYPFDQAFVQLWWIFCDQSYGCEIETWKHVSNVLTWDSEFPTGSPASEPLNVLQALASEKFHRAKASSHLG